MKKVKVEDAIGMVLAHDLTKIVPGEFKGAAFKKGHTVTKEDIDSLKDMGKNHIFVLELLEDEIHEDDAALRISSAIGGEGLVFQGPSEGKISIKSGGKGLLKINTEALAMINSIEMIIVATLHNNTVVEKGQTVAGTRIIPLTTSKSKIEEVEKICETMGKVIEIREIKPLKVGVVVTGSEVYSGRITDRFGPVLEEKTRSYGGTFIGTKYAPDHLEKIEEAIKEFIDQGAEIILTSGGMSVDADDVTPTAIRNISNEIVTYGAPVLPGAMFMMGYKDNVAIMGIPACGMYHKTTVFDLVFPRVLAKEIVTRQDIVKLGHGGLCLGCKVCHYPVCPFGK